METIAAGEIFGSVAERAGMERDEIEGGLFQGLRSSLRRRVREGYQFARWPELLLLEKRYFRPVAVTGEAVAAGAERFVPQTSKYYQALKATTDFPIDPVTEVTSGSWAESKTSYSGDWWVAGTSYAVGAVARNAADDLFYQMHTAGPAGTPLSDAGFWGVLTEFDRFIAYEAAGQSKIGTVFEVSRYNPKTQKASCPVGFAKSENGVQVLDDVPYVWLEFRQRPPVLVGEVWDASVVYGPIGTGTAAEHQAYFSGDFYECVAVTAPNQSPATNPANWELLGLPLFLERWLVGSVYADYLEMEGQKDKAMAELGSARGGLEDEGFVLGAQEGQMGRMEVGTR